VSNIYKGSPLTPADLEAFARGFGFASPRHLDDVLKGREPSALRDSRMHDKSWDTWRKRKAVAEDLAELAVMTPAQREHDAVVIAEAQRLNETRRQKRQQSSREARYRVLDRKAGTR
jgi:hypothetical protein